MVEEDCYLNTEKTDERWLDPLDDHRTADVLQMTNMLNTIVFNTFDLDQFMSAHVCN